MKRLILLGLLLLVASWTMVIHSGDYALFYTKPLLTDPVCRAWKVTFVSMTTTQAQVRLSKLVGQTWYVQGNKYVDLGATVPEDQYWPQLEFRYEAGTYPLYISSESTYKFMSPFLACLVYLPHVYRPGQAVMGQPHNPYP